MGTTRFRCRQCPAGQRPPACVDGRRPRRFGGGHSRGIQRVGSNQSHRRQMLEHSSPEQWTPVRPKHQRRIVIRPRSGKLTDGKWRPRAPANGCCKSRLIKSFVVIFIEWMKVRTTTFANRLQLGFYSIPASIQSDIDTPCAAFLLSARNSSTLCPRISRSGIFVESMANTILVGAQWGDEGKGK